MKREKKAPAAKKSFVGGLFKTGLAVGLALGLIGGIELCAMGDLLSYPIDAFLFILAFSLFSVFLNIIFFSILGLLFRPLFAKKEDASDNVPAFIRRFGLFIILFSQLFIFWIEINRPVYATSFKLIGGGILMLFVAAVLTWLLFRFWRTLADTPIIGKLNAILQKPFIWLPNYIILVMILLALIPLIFLRTPVRDEPVKGIPAKGKVVFIGVDAAYWPTLMPLIEAGKLPNFERLVKEGAHGDLPTLISMYNPIANTITHGIKSAAIWTSLLTGKSPAKHGIKDFVYTRIPGISHPFRYPLLPSFTPQRKKLESLLGLQTLPFNRLHRKSKAVWNILSEDNLEVSALGWWMTWPAEIINGDLLSDRFDDAHLPRRWFPQELVTRSEVDSLLALMKNPKEEDLALFTSFKYDSSYKEKYDKKSMDYLRNDLVSNLVKSFYEDLFRSRLGLRLLDKHQYTFFSVYFYGIDTAGHAFMRYKYPDIFPDVGQQDIDYFGQVIDRYYQWVDSEIGKYLDRIDDNTTVVICSDHGMGPWLGARLSRKDVRLSGSHRKEGIVILWGKNIRRGVTVKPRNVLDVLPTMLYLIGLPVAEDMDGQVMKDAIDPQFLQSNPVQKVSTYETERYRLKSMTEIGAVKGLDEGMMKRLRALGYVK